MFIFLTVASNAKIDSVCIYLWQEKWMWMFGKAWCVKRLPFCFQCSAPVPTPPSPPPNVLSFVLPLECLHPPSYPPWKNQSKSSLILTTQTRRPSKASRRWNPPKPANHHTHSSGKGFTLQFLFQIHLQPFRLLFPKSSNFVVRYITMFLSTCVSLNRSKIYF